MTTIPRLLEKRKLDGESALKKARVVSLTISWKFPLLMEASLYITIESGDGVLWRLSQKMV
ncbi:hypothetical protein NCCP28_31000 [Niallia sp. NCCP-28]|nr:hypothetical protein NCCP28_31000 [Niallia sp. NCCP-28]